jgi:hypothetical protein
MVAHIVPAPGFDVRLNRNDTNQQLVSSFATVSLAQQYFAGKSALIWPTRNFDGPIGGPSV